MGSNRPTCPEVRGKQDRDYGCSSQCWLGSVAKSTRAKLTLTCYWSRVGTRANHDFVPNPPLPSQFLYAPKESTPERRLMAAVLADAVAIIQHGPEYHEGRPYRDALAWVMAERNDWPFCFVALCEALELNADKVRAQLLGR